LADINELVSKDALDSVNKLEATFAKIVSTIDTLVAKSKTLDQLISAMNKSADAQTQINKAGKEATDINKQLASTNEDVVKAKIKFLNATKDQRDELKALVTLEDEEAGYLEKVRAKIAQLNQEKNKVKETDKDWKKQISDINKEIDKNNAILKENSSQLGKQKIGIGAYAQGIKDAAIGMVSFGGVIGLAMTAINKLYDAFLATEAGAKFKGEIKQISETFIQNLIPSIKAYWGAFFSGDAEKAKKVQLDVIKNSADAARAADELNKLRIEERKENEQNAKDETQITLNRIAAAKALDDSAEKVRLLTEAEKLEDDIITRKKEHLTAELVQYKILSDARKDNTELLDIISQKTVELTKVEGERSLRLIKSTIKAEKEEEIRLTDLQIEKERALVVATEEQMRAEQRRNFTPVEGPGASNKSIIGDSKLTEKRQKNIADIGNEIDKANERIAKENEKAARKELQMKEQKANLEKEIIKGVFDFESALVERKIQKLENQKNIELSAANLTAAQKTAINEKYAKQEGALKRKAAIAEKASAVFSIALDTAKGVMKATAALMIPLIPFIIAAGAVQLAAVIAKPIPQYAKGTHSASGGKSIVGEYGSELMISPSGQIGLSPDEATLMDIQRGTKIIPSDETKRILNAATNAKNNGSDATQERRHKELLNTIKNKREIILRPGTGRSIVEREGNIYKEYYNRHLS
jgi:hypothetical protein